MVSQPPEEEQERLAHIILAEWDAEKRWEELFSSPESEEWLCRMADQALAAHRSGLTRPLH